MRFAEQARVFRMIPGLENAEFLRYGQIHRNTYINAPALLTPTLQLRTPPRVFFAGQISGVEGYVESIATGLVAGRHAVGTGRWRANSGRSRAKPRSARCALTYLERMRAIISPPISLSICCRRSTTTRAIVCATTRRPVTPRSAAGRWKDWTNTARICLTLRARSTGFSMSCAARMPPPTRVRNYASDLAAVSRLLHHRRTSRATVEEIDALAIREWLGYLYEQRLTAVSMRRKLAAVRSLFKFLTREGVVATNVARLVRTPKAPKSLPVVMTAEQTNTLVDAVPATADKLDRPFPARDLAIFELLYGCGLAHQRTGRIEPRRFRFQRALDARARQRPQRAPGPVRHQSRGSAGPLSSRAGSPPQPASALCF